MSAPNRSTLLTKTFKVLKKHYKPVDPPADRPVLEHLLYACCLENAKHESADEAFALLQESYFDWNEIRVTSVTELGEVMGMLPDSNEAAARLKRTLQSVFEMYYSFDLEELQKQNIGKATKDIEKLNGVTPFAVAYLTQCGLGGHAIPFNHSVVDLLQVLGVITPAEAAKHKVPGMERAIPKSKGVEFASLLHQFGVDYGASPHSPKLRAIILEIAPDAKERLPKRTTKKKTASSSKSSSSKSSSSKSSSSKSSDKKTTKSSKPAAKSTSKAKTPAKKTTKKAAKKKISSKKITKRKPR